MKAVRHTPLVVTVPKHGKTADLVCSLAKVEQPGVVDGELAEADESMHVVDGHLSPNLLLVNPILGITIN